MHISTSFDSKKTAKKKKKIQKGVLPDCGVIVQFSISFINYLYHPLTYIAFKINWEIYLLQELISGQISQNKVTNYMYNRSMVFLQHVLSNPISRKHPQSQDRGCQTFYTCAVDTDTVKKVFNACKASLTDINF